MTVSIRQVLVHLDASDTVAARLAVAREIAQHQGASVQALYGVLPVFLEIPYATDMAPAIAASLAELDDERRRRSRAAFDEILRTPGPIAQWAECSEAPVIGCFVEQALYADLLVLGQHNPDDALSSGVPADFDAAVLVDSGKPAVVVPYTGWQRPIGTTVAIAWKPTREAARAVQAALPLLQRARHVHILGWAQQPVAGVAGRPLGLLAYLRLHGVDAQWHDEGDVTDEIGERLLSRVADLEADLLVMGCYGHSRARELVLGGATRTILQSMTVPVLMSH